MYPIAVLNASSLGVLVHTIGLELADASTIDTLLAGLEPRFVAQRFRARESSECAHAPRVISVKYIAESSHRVTQRKEL